MRDAKEIREKKIAPRNPGDEERARGGDYRLSHGVSFRALLAPRISRGHFFLANFFRVTHDGLSERGTTRSLVHVL